MAKMVDVSTLLDNCALKNGIDPCGSLRSFLLGAGDVQCLLGPEQLTTRLILLDKLDALFGDVEMATGGECSDRKVISVADGFRFQLEAANETLFAVARAELTGQGTSYALRRWLMGRPNCTAGVGFDSLDEIVSGVLRFSEPGAVSPLECPEMVPYQPTPARHVVELIAALKLSSDDVLVDLGSGLGHVPLLVSILTGSRAVGVEFEPAYVACARECARRLRLSRVGFIAGDARGTDLSKGTVFYLFSPFRGSVLNDMLGRLRGESMRRPIRICSLGPCTRVLQAEPWLKAAGRTTPERISVFEPR
jgi:hypothetical protein